SPTPVCSAHVRVRPNHNARWPASRWESGGLDRRSDRSERDVGAACRGGYQDCHVGGARTRQFVLAPYDDHAMVVPHFFQSSEQTCGAAGSGCCWPPSVPHTTKGSSRSIVGSHRLAAPCRIKSAVPRP